MCHNHSHLIATFLGEDTQHNLPVLTYLMEKDLLRIESPQRDGGSIIVRTSRLLRVPSLMLAGYSPRPPPRTADDGMSLFFLPDGAMTTILAATWAWLNASPISPAVSGGSALRRPHILKNDDDQGEQWVDGEGRHHGPPTEPWEENVIW